MTLSVGSAQSCPRAKPVRGRLPGDPAWCQALLGPLQEGNPADGQGKPFTVRYEEVNAMLLNEFMKEHKNVERQQATIAELKSTVAR